MRDFNVQIQERADLVDQKILNVGPQELEPSMDPLFFASVQAVEEVGQKYLRHNTTEDRIKFVKETLNWAAPRPHRPEILKRYEKHAETSNLLRAHGNSLFRQRKFRDALHYFNVPLLFGVDKFLGLAYANRAAVLMELDDPTGAVEDIDLALKNNYPASQIQKLEQRKLKCLQMIEKTQSEDAAIKHLIDEERAELIKIRDSFGRMEKRNPRAPAAADFVAIKFDETYGRQLVVTRDVAPGTLLLVEDPYICVLQGQYNWDTEHCHHCLKRITRGIPCDKCVFAIYCDEACLRKALESTHQFECNILPHVHLARIPYYAFVALRLVCKVGPAELYRIFSSHDPVFFNREQAFGTAPKDVYESDSYLSVHHLQSHPECIDFGYQCAHANQALLMTEYLDTKSTFFESIPQGQKNTFKDFVAALMVHHIESRLVNAATLIEFDGLEDLTVESVLRYRTNDPEKLSARLRDHQFNLKMFGTGFYPLFSLLNHSCAPNAFYLKHDINGTMSVIAARRMKKGEQIFISYVPPFFSSPKNDRQAGLKYYNFDCSCIACRNNWPTPADMIGGGVRFSCYTCSKEFSSEEKDSAEFLKCELSEPSWTCGRCGKRYKSEELQKRYRVHMNLRVEGKDQLLRGNPKEALRIFLKLLDYFQCNLTPPEVETHGLTELLSNSLGLILQLAQ